MKGEYYKMEWEAWDEGTVDLTLEQEAAYLRLCHQMYRRQGGVPDSIKLLRILWRCGHNKAVALLNALIAAGKIKRSEQGVFTQSRVSRELVDRESMSSRRRVAGELGGSRSGVSRRNALKTQDPDEAHASHLSNQKRGEEKRIITTKQNVKTIIDPTTQSELETVLDSERAAAVVEHRKKLKAPLTPRAARLLAKQFAKCPDPGAAADTMIMRGWQGFEPGWLDHRNGSRGPPADMFRDSGGELTERDTSKMRAVPPELTEAQIRAGVK